MSIASKRIDASGVTTARRARRLASRWNWRLIAALVLNLLAWAAIIAIVR